MRLRARLAVPHSRPHASCPKRQVLFGRTIADAFVQGFSAQAVPTDAITARDAALQFPWQPCARGHPASATHLCWEDLRPPGQARTCREVLTERYLTLALSLTPHPHLPYPHPNRNSNPNPNQ